MTAGAPLAAGLVALALGAVVPAPLAARRRASRPPWMTAAAFGLVAAVLAGPTAGAAAVVLAGITLAARQRFGRRRAAAEADRAVTEFAAALAGELRAGQPLGRALAAAAPAGGPFAGALTGLAAAGDGPDVVAGLRDLAAAPGGAGLRAVAAAWQVAAGQGAGVADLLDRVAAGLAAERRVADEAAAQLAGARATVRVVLALPAAGVALGGMVGAAPLHFLLRTALGAALLGAAAVLDATGVWWLSRLEAAAGGW